MRGFLAGLAAVAAALIVTAQPAAACAGLIGPNGAVNLLRTTTFAGYHDGIEHYVTSFQFAGGSGQFGSLIPLPGVPDKVEKGGDWTLQRLIRETNPIVRNDARSLFAVAAPQGVQVLMEVRIDALDITVLKGGGPVGAAPHPRPRQERRRSHRCRRVSPHGPAPRASPLPVRERHAPRPQRGGHERTLDRSSI